MKEEIISFETAKLAKEKGLEPDRGYYYDKNGKLYGVSGSIYYAPTQSLLQKWLREKHDIHAYCTPSRHFIARDFDNYSFSVLYVDNLWEDDGSYDLYEEALEAGLKYALNLIK